MRFLAFSGRRLEPWLFGSLGILFLIWALSGPGGLRGDEGRYLAYARNILQGGYASEETLFLWNAPGFPLVVAAVQALQLPLAAVKVLNAAFLLGAVWQFRGLLKEMGIPKAPWLAAALGIFLLFHGALIEQFMSEPLAVFLCSTGARYAFSFLEKGGRSRALAAGLSLGALAMTKGFYGYALAACLALAGLWLVLTRTRMAGRALRVCGLALAATTPYLLYTWHATGRFFYWGNSGGALLYCLSLPEPRFRGDWFNSDAVKAHPEFFGPHCFLYRRLESLDFVSRDDSLKAAAWRNIRNHPGKFLRNWRANVNRMVFGFPVSDFPGANPELATGNRAFVYAFPFAALLFALPALGRARRAVPPGLWALAVFLAVSFGGLSLLAAIPRQIFPLLPLVWGLVAFAWGKPGTATEGLATG